MKDRNSTTKPSKIIELLTISIRIRRSKKVLIVSRSEFAEANRNKVGASRWLATSGSPEQFGWQNRSHTGKEIFHSCGSGQPPADPYEMTE